MADLHQSEKMTDYVYVVVSSGKDTYLEQTVLSIESLKRATGTRGVYVLIDPKTQASLTGRRAKLYDVADHVVTVDCPAEYDAQQRSRYLKTTMYSHIDNDFIYIDGDTLVCEDLSSAAGDYDVALVLDRHSPVSSHPRADRLDRRAKRCGFATSFADKHFNSGFMYVRKSPVSERFFSLWNQLWRECLTHNVSQDQTSLNEANVRMGGVVHELDGVYNCQICDAAGLRFLNQAKMIHYFASGGSRIPFNLADDSIIRHALDESYPEGLRVVLEEPRAAYRFIKHYISDSSAGKVCLSKTFRLEFELLGSKSCSAKALYRFMEMLSKAALAVRRWSRLAAKSRNRRRANPE